MRTTFLLLLLLASTIPSHAVKPTNKEYDFVWGETFEKLPRDPKITIDTRGGGLGLVYFGEVPADMELQTIGPDILSKLRTGQFAIEGTIAYYKLLPGSFLEMWCYFAPEKPGGPEIGYVTRTLDTDDPMSKVAGWEQDKHFQLPFDISGAKTQLKRVVLKVHLTGGYDTHVVLNNVKLVEHPKGSLPVTIPSLSNLSPDLPPPARTTDNAPEMRMIADLPIEKYLSSEQDQKDLLANFSKHDASEDRAKVTVVKEADGTSELLVTRTGTTGLCRTALLTVPQDVVRQITGTRYGIMGDVSYSLADRGALGMESVYSQIGLNAPIDRWHQALEGPSWGAHGESMGLMEDNRDWGKFYLGFDRRWADRKPNADLMFKRIIFNVLLDGSGTVHLRNLKLVQYPEPPPESMARTPPTPPATNSAMSTARIDWKSFLLGVAATGVSPLAGGGIIFVSRRWNRRRHERELRRMASLDG